MRRLTAVALAALLAAAAIACSPAASISEAEDAGRAASGSSPGTPLHSDAPPPEPDQLDDPGVAPGECDTITYTPDGASQAHQGELCRPESNQRDVAVVIVHGGGGYSGSHHGMKPWANRLLAEGYVTFAPSYHLFDRGVDSPVFPLPEQDIKAAVQYLRGTGNALGVRKDRIVVQGHSAGARLGAAAYTSGGQEWYQGDELYSDIADRADGFIGFYHTFDGSMELASQYYGGSETSTSAVVLERWDRADSIANAAAGNVGGPALLISGSEDWEEIDAQMALFCEAIEDAGESCDEAIVEGGGHGFDQVDNRHLSKLGEQSATIVLVWLNDQFPQNPPRDAQSVDPELEEAPDYTGQTATTYPQRSSGSRTRSPNRQGGGAYTTTTVTGPEPSPTSTSPPNSSTTSPPPPPSSTVPPPSSTTPPPPPSSTTVPTSTAPP